VTWTLEELAERAARALVDADVRVANGRVTGVPDARLIRWYATIGLVDRPLIGPGRVARYTIRHLLQLVAVKRLQAQGLPLAEVQHRLAGATEGSLRRIAALPAGLDQPAQDLPVPADRKARLHEESERSDHGPGGDVPAVLRRPRRHLLRDMPEAATPGDGVSPPDAPVGDTTTTRFWAVRPGSPQSAGGPGFDQRVDVERDTVTRVYGVRFHGLTLLLPAQPADDDLDAITAAARPLLDLLAERGLLHRMAEETPREGAHE
jgi:DNA-binding transcriptional MerR regulator